MITLPDYNAPLIIPGGYFNGRITPLTPIEFNDFLTTYHLDYLRYLYFLCIIGAEGEYPLDITLEEIEEAFNNQDRNCIPRINKILIGEAPPPNYTNYFYNINSPWNAVNGNPGVGQGWTTAIKNALFPGMIFHTKTEFLIACAQSGFLLLDLFPYPITYTGRNTIMYQNACINAFRGTYPINFISQLNSIICCISIELSIGFAMRSFGEYILNSADCVTDFHSWQALNGIILNPLGSINLIRPIPIIGASNFLRICYQGGANNGGPMGPNVALMNIVGIV
jgi:hypothetical protein